MDQIIRKLSNGMIKRIESQRDWVRNHYNEESIDKYETIDGKLKLLDLIIKSNWIQKDETNKLQCLGITLGDIFVQDLGFRWIEIEDEHGIDPAIKLDNTTIILFPLTMISKRIENGESVDLYGLYDEIKSKVAVLKGKE